MSSCTRQGTFAAACTLLALFLARGSHADVVVASIPTGLLPNSVAVNPVTGRVYVGNVFGNSVTVVDGASGTTTGTLAVGSNPIALGVDAVSDRIYVANQLGASVSVIDGGSGAVAATVAVGTNPRAIAVDPGTHRVYVANAVSNTVSVIDGATDTVLATPAAGSVPVAMAVNPATHRVYVANFTSGDVTVIDGTTNAVLATVTAGASPVAIAVNPATNRVYVANQGANSVTVIDGATNAVLATVPTLSMPVAVAVNAVTNRIYVADQGGEAMVIDGAANTASSVAVGVVPAAIAVNPATNKIYVANLGASTVTVIDGSSGGTATVGVGAQPGAIAVNPVTNRIYVTNQNSNNASIIEEALPQAVPLVTAIGTLPGDQTPSAAPAFVFTVTSSFTPTAPPVQAVYYRFDSREGPWQKAAGAGPYSGTASALSLGPHVIYAFAVDGEEATSTNLGSPLVGRMAAYAFTVVPPTVPAAPVITSVVAGDGQASIAFSAPPSDGGSTITSYTVTCNPGSISASGAASPLVVSGLTNGTPYVCSVTATNGVGTGPAATASVIPSWRSFTAPSATGTGLVTASFTGGGPGCSFTSARLIPLSGDPASPPAGSAPAAVAFPHGLFVFTTGGCAAGSSITMTISWPAPLPAGTTYWKYGPTPGNPAPHWYVLPASASLNTTTFTITDGGVGDDDLVVNGNFADQGGPGVPAAGAIVPVPTLGEWNLLLLASLLIVAAGWRSRSP